MQVELPAERRIHHIQFDMVDTQGVVAEQPVR